MADWASAGDLLDRTATQVESGGAVHTLKADDFAPDVGRQYWTRCGRLLLKEQGAVLTTRHDSCGTCAGAAVVAHV